ncbi:MAG: FapA family protein [Brevinematia bacterium]
MDILRDFLEEDQKKDFGVKSAALPSENTEIEVLAFTIEEALRKASEALNVSMVNLEYEILERGKNGFFGIGKKPLRVLVRVASTEKVMEELLGSEEAPIFGAPVVNQDGMCKIVVKRDGIFLKITAPRGNGKPVDIKTVQSHLIAREISKYNEAIVKREVENPSEKYVKIGDYTPSMYDSKIQLQISPDEMKAYVTMTKPEKYGRVPDVDEIISMLKAKNVVYGIKEKTIEEAIENELFNVPIIVAEGDVPQDGSDAQIQFHFKVDTDKVEFEVKEDGSVDFHKLDLIQSVVAGQVLATKIPAQRGKAGKTITGRIIPARDGKDIKLSPGNNTHLSNDGMQVIADINGQVLFKNNKIQVEPVYEVSGDVDLTTGDINFPGNVIIHGNVNDTFKVYAGGNLEITGNVGKAEVVAEGNVVIRQGVQGKDEGKIVSAGDVYAKFIERAKVKAEGYIIVTDVILHSNVESKKKIICQGGKRSQIAGGKARALYEINAKFLGAEAYTETLIEVGTDPEAEDRLGELLKRRDEIQKEQPEIIQQLSYLSELLGKGPLPPDKADQYNTLTLKQTQFKQELGEIEQEVSKIQNYLDGLGKDAKISASKTVYPGVKIKIKNEVLIVKSEYKYVTFYREGGMIKISPYEKTKEMDEKLKEATTIKKSK